MNAIRMATNHMNMPKQITHMELLIWDVSGAAGVLHKMSKPCIAKRNIH